MVRGGDQRAQHNSNHPTPPVRYVERIASVWTSVLPSSIISHRSSTSSQQAQTTELQDAGQATDVDVRDFQAPFESSMGISRANARGQPPSDRVTNSTIGDHYTTSPTTTNTTPGPPSTTVRSPSLTTATRDSRRNLDSPQTSCCVPLMVEPGMWAQKRGRLSGSMKRCRKPKSMVNYREGLEV